MTGEERRETERNSARVCLWGWWRNAELNATSKQIKHLRRGLKRVDVPRRSIFATRCETSSGINARCRGNTRRRPLSRFSTTLFPFFSSFFILFSHFCFFFLFLFFCSELNRHRYASTVADSVPRSFGLFNDEGSCSFTCWLISIESRGCLLSITPRNGEFSSR